MAQNDPSQRTGLGPSSNQRRLIDRRARRPVWPIVAIVVYALVYLGLVAFMLIGSIFFGDDDLLIWALAVSGGMLILSSLLLIAPVRVATRRPATRSSLWPALFAGGAMIAALILAGGLAVIELIDEEPPDELWIAGLMAAAGVWIGWAVVFYIQSARAPVASVAFSLYRWLLRGSVVELIVAVSCHLVVRRRTECSAGVLTTLGIVTGAAAMLVAFGPALLVLYMQRSRQLRPNLRLADVNPNPRRTSWFWVGLWIVLAALVIALLVVVSDGGWVVGENYTDIDPATYEQITPVREVDPAQPPIE